MFARFTKLARQTVVLAQQQARQLRAPQIGTEHLLLGLLAEGAGVAGTALREAGLNLEDARVEIRQIAGCGVVVDADSEALLAIGIDLDRVRATVEESFGPGALERGRRVGRRRAASVPGHIPFSPRAKTALELSLREALRLRHRSIGPEHVLLALLRQGKVGVLVLARRGIDSKELRRRVVTAITTTA
ncbi:MAG: Clp protease [Nitriliruptorales bacterium]|nr:Clp protease [Nitriliruptorales bacterium]